MSNKTEFKDVLVTDINFKEKGIVTFKIEDKRTYEGKTTTYSFDIASRIEALPASINTGDRVFIEATLLNREYEYQGKTRHFLSIWALKVYKLDMQLSAIEKPKNEPEIDIPF